ncbi:hypothetical protein B0H21DRAFT_396450 [Amylocystis lapponica]|nr:hypothetical protein B0H21DRAFT_396450 [Amylocystis lapponica]
MTEQSLNVYVPISPALTTSIDKACSNSTCMTCRSLGSRDMVDSFRVQVASAKALLTDDILRDIFLHLDPRCKTRSDLARLARVCKFFSEPALDLLWKDLSDVFLLLRILPSFVDSDGQKFLNGPITQDAWSRFQYYARRVRSLVVRPTNLDPSVFPQLAHHATRKPLCPSLVSLEWRQDPPMDQGLFAFLGESLRSLSISLFGLNHNNVNHANNAIKGVLYILRSCAPRLQDLTLDYHGPCLELLPIAHLHALQKLCVRSCVFPVSTTQLFHSCAGMSNLRELSITLGTTNDPVISFGTAFPALEVLDVTGRTSDVTHLLSAMSSSPLHSVMICEFNPVEWRGLETCCAALGIHFSASLTIVRLVSDVDDSNIGPLQVLQTLQPLLQLQRMKSFELSITDALVSMLDQDISAMAKAWPEIENLTLNCDFAPQSPPSIYSLAAFAHHCPNLGKLHFTSLTSTKHPPSEFMTIKALSHPLRQLTFWFDYGFAGSPMEIAGFIDHIFPDVEVLGYAAWEEVSDALVLLKRARRAERDRVIGTSA